MQTPHGHFQRPDNQRNVSINSSKDFRKKVIDQINETIACPDFLQRSRMPGFENAFTRNRKLPFGQLLVFLTQLYEKSLDRELNEFLKALHDRNLNLPRIAKSALTRSRAKLHPDAFKELNRVAGKSFYTNAPYLTWQGFRLLTIDGSTLPLPNHNTVKKTFGVTTFGKKADIPVSMARISMLYDVLNMVTLDVQMDRFDCSERTLAAKHFSSVKRVGDLVLFDRGYPSFPLMYQMEREGIDYCIRAREDWWLEIRKMKKEGEKDKIVTLPLGRKDRELMEQYGDTKGEFTCRLCDVRIPGGSSIVLCTSVLDKERLPYGKLAELYHHRWKVEESYKMLKSRMKVEAFSGKTATAVMQDFYSKVFLSSVAAILSFPVEEEMKKANAERLKEHPKKVNRTNAVSFARKILCGLLIKKKKAGTQTDVNVYLDDFDEQLRNTPEPERLKRSNPRKYIRKNPPSMNYKS